MNISKLKSADIKKFSKILKKRGIKRSALEIFFDSIISLISPYEHNVTQNIDIIMEECVFDGVDDVNIFLRDYSDFTNSAIFFINSIGELEDEELFDEEIDPILKAFCSDCADCHEVLLENIDRAVKETIVSYDIAQDIFVDIDAMSSVLGEQGAEAFSMLMMSFVMMRSEDVGKDDFEVIKTNFILLCIFVYILDEFRKDIILSENHVARTNQEKIEKVGRNDPCPCGSGKKYKKCCIDKKVSFTKIYQLKISIKGAKPPIWRRVLVDEDMTYYDLHKVIQTVFDWDDSHIHEFITNVTRYSDEEFELEGTEDEYRYKINKDLKEPKDKIAYIYDFGDSWQHEIVLEDVLEKDEGAFYPRCIKGKGREPIEDIGGIYTYNEIVNAYKNRDKEILESYHIDKEFDPKEFSLDKVNFFLKLDI